MSGPSNRPSSDRDSGGSGSNSEALRGHQSTTEGSKGQSLSPSGSGGERIRETSGSKPPNKRDSRHTKERAILVEAEEEYRAREDSAIHNLGTLSEEIERCKKELERAGKSE